MSNLEYLLYLILLSITIVFLVIVYFYNKRHAKPKHIRKNKEHVFLKENKEVVYKRNEMFDWDVYKDEVNLNELKFLGLDIWEEQGRAIKRLKELKKEFEENKYIHLNVIEMLFLLEDSSDQISISENGNYYVHSFGIKTLLEKVYDVQTKQKVEQIKANLINLNKEIEIDAKRLFFIMKNAKNFGLDRISDNSIFFQFLTRKNEKIVIDLEAEENTIKDNKIKVTLEEFKEDDEIESKRALGISSPEERDLTNTFREMTEEFKRENKVTSLEDGVTEIIYSNGLQLKKKGPWEIIDVKTIEDRQKIELEKEQQKIKEKNKLAEGVIAEDAKLTSEDKKEALAKSEVKENEKPKVDLEEKDYLIVPNTNNYLFSENGELVSFYRFFKNANDLESLKIEISQLSKENLLKIIEILISNNLIKVLVGNTEIPMFVKSNNLYYLNYELVIYSFLTMVNEQNKLIKALKGTNSTLVLDYPVSFVLDYLNAFKTTYNLNLVEDDRKPSIDQLENIVFE